MRTFTFIFVIISSLYACSERREGEIKPTLASNFVSITDNEDKGVEEVLSFYGGYCKYSIGANLSTKTGKTNYFELEMSKSEVLDDLADKLEMPASNIAYLFYRNLKHEHAKYDEIHSTIILKDGRKMTFKFSRKELEMVSKRMQLVEKTVDLMIKKDYASIRQLLNGKPAKINEDELIAKLKETDPKFGDISKFIPYGYRVDVTKTGLHVLHISGGLLRDIQNSEFSIDVNLHSNKNEVFLIDYKL